ncbi:MarR family winged helix-turn-helix transcriptional regulator [Agromyces sp. Soil535]|uniref:MarR family winged helix-turn-helix transcriptional regulator n=1 Tax=Agromyces sp. Soil535 TaxID=1736390 RepID=UPI0006FC1AC3|nr:MarR family transcriptional regulator [Agromyces sp. Soil535]KRE23321.1 hypothetical protein ASG80_06245 [Agromyces sp. Soil535]
MPSTTDSGEEFSWEDSLPYLLWRTQNAVHRYIQPMIDDIGVTVTQLGLAVHLHKLGPLSASDMSRGFRITPQSVSTALSRLEKIGWVERAPHPVHGRVVLFRLSEEGVTGVRQGTERMAVVTENLTSMLSEGAAPMVIDEFRRILLELEGSDRPMELLWPIRG